MSSHLHAARSLFSGDEVRDVLRDTFYAAPDPAPTPIEPKGAPPASLDASGKRRRAPKKAKKADHYEILCISMYVEDLARLDEKVAALKQGGHRRMTRSALIRLALDKIALGDVPAPSY
jgi:hypothetical protein